MKPYSQFHGLWAIRELPDVYDYRLCHDMKVLFPCYELLQFESLLTYVNYSVVVVTFMLLLNMRTIQARSWGFSQS